MTEFDSFATQLLEESKTLLEKAKRVEGFSKITYYHSSLLLAISALEACINSIADEILIDPYKNEYTIYEQGLLLEKDVRFDKGEFVLSNGLKISRITDRIEFLYYKFTRKRLDGTYQWYANLRQCIDIRNKLVHPKEQLRISDNQVELAILSVIETINQLYLAVYKRKFPAYDWGINPRKELLL